MNSGASLTAAQYGLDSRGMTGRLLGPTILINLSITLVWAVYRDGSQVYARCRACEHETDRPTREIRRCKEHERSATHQRKIIDRQLRDSTQPLMRVLDEVNYHSPSHDDYVIPSRFPLNRGSSLTRGLLLSLLPFILRISTAASKPFGRIFAAWRSHRLFATRFEMRSA